MNYVLIVVLLVLVNAVFAMSEAALLSVRRSRIDQLVEEGNRAARIAAHLLDDPTRMLSTIQVGVTLVGLFSAGFAAESMVEPLAAWLAARFPGFVADHAHTLAFTSIMFAVSLLSLVVGEITPKSVAIGHAERIALTMARPVRWLQVATTPLVAFVTALSGVLTRPFGVSAGFHPSALGEDELRLLVEQSEEHGVIRPSENEMIQSVFDFGDTRVRAVMTPRPDIVAVEASATVAELMARFVEQGLSRMPVKDGDLDHVVGVVHVKDVLPPIAEGDMARPVRLFMRPPLFVPDSKPAAELLQELRRSSVHLALVQDEHGTITGLVTIEDLLEEIVGEIRDEYDADEAAPRIVSLDDRTTLIDAGLRLGEFDERMGTSLAGSPADTLGGLVIQLLGHLPRQGESARAGGLEFSVEVVEGRRVRKIRVTRNGPSA